MAVGTLQWKGELTQKLQKDTGLRHWELSNVFVLEVNLGQFCYNGFFTFFSICVAMVFFTIVLQSIFPYLVPAIMTKFLNAINQNYFQINKIRDTLPCKKKLSTKKTVYNFPILLKGMINYFSASLKYLIHHYHN